jgi:hypothetical protein
MGMTDTNEKNGFVAPYWAKAGVFFIKEIGFPGVLAIVLIGILTGYVKSPSIENQELIKSLLKSNVLHNEESATFRRIFVREMNYQNLLLRRICRNTSNSEVQQQRCEEVGKLMEQE